MIFSPTERGWTLDHVAHAVRDLNPVRECYLRHFGFSIVSEAELSDHRVHVLFLSLGNSLLELLTPLPGNESLTRFLEKRGEGLHHVCFRVNDIRAELGRLSREGMKLVDSLPRPGSHGMEIAFIHPQSTSGMLVELCSPLSCP